MSKQSELAAMRYLADKKPKQYNLFDKHFMPYAELWEWTPRNNSRYDYVGSWVTIHTVRKDEA